MKKVFWALSALCICLLFGLQATNAALVVYTQPPINVGSPTFTVSHYEENTDPNGWVIDYRAYDNFILSSPTLVTDLHWWGGFDNPDLHNSILSFNVEVFDNDPNFDLINNLAGPGTQVYSTNIPIGDVNVAVFETDVNNVPLSYSYSADLPVPEFVPANTMLWLMIQAVVQAPDVDDPDAALYGVWGWRDGFKNQSDGLWSEIVGDPNPFEFFEVEAAFELTGDIIPEPASVLVWCGVMGVFGGLAIVRRRRGKK